MEEAGPLTLKSQGQTEVLRSGQTMNLNTAYEGIDGITSAIGTALELFNH